MATMSEEDAPEAVPAEVAEASVEHSGAAQVFRVPGSIDIPGDGAPHTLGLGEYKLPCRFEYVAAPVIAPGVHLRAIATNATGAVLLPGELHVFHAGPAADEYVGATQLVRTAEGAEIKLYLGLDDNVTLKRELIERAYRQGKSAPVWYTPYYLWLSSDAGQPDQPATAYRAYGSIAGTAA